MKAADLDPNDQVVRAAVFGQQVQDFLQGPLGDYLLRQAERRLKELLEELKKVDPAMMLHICALQAEIRYLEGFEAWLGTAVQEGLTAMAIIEGDDLDA